MTTIDYLRSGPNPMLTDLQNPEAWTVVDQVPDNNAGNWLPTKQMAGPAVLLDQPTYYYYKARETVLLGELQDIYSNLRRVAVYPLFQGYLEVQTTSPTYVEDTNVGQTLHSLGPGAFKLIAHRTRGISPTTVTFETRLSNTYEFSWFDVTQTDGSIQVTSEGEDHPEGELAAPTVTASIQDDPVWYDFQVTLADERQKIVLRHVQHEVLTLQDDGQRLVTSYPGSSDWVALYPDGQPLTRLPAIRIQCAMDYAPKALSFFLSTNGQDWAPLEARIQEGEARHLATVVSASDFLANWVSNGAPDLGIALENWAHTFETVMLPSTGNFNPPFTQPKYVKLVITKQDDTQVTLQKSLLSLPDSLTLQKIGNGDNMPYLLALKVNTSRDYKTIEWEGKNSLHPDWSPLDIFWQGSDYTWPYDHSPFSQTDSGSFLPSVRPYCQDGPPEVAAAFVNTANPDGHPTLPDYLRVTLTCQDGSKVILYSQDVS